MEHIPLDLHNLITSQLTMRESVRLLACSTTLHKKKEYLRFTKPICISEILGNAYYNNFVRVYIEENYLKFINKKLICGQDYNTFSLPLHIQRLYFSCDFNEYIGKNDIPFKITHVIFNHRFNRQIQPDAIPSSVKYLQFGERYNRSIKNIIPSSIKTLKFGYNFNKSIKGNIPYGVQKLSLGSRFDMPIQDCIPSSVYYVKIQPNDINRAEELPTSVTHLELIWNHIFAVRIPSHITHLILTSNFGNLVIPPNVTHVIFKKKFKPSRDGLKKWSDIMKLIPASVTTLTFKMEYYDFIMKETNVPIPYHIQQVFAIYDKFDLSNPVTRVTIM